MAWITEAKNSGEMEALAGVPDACIDVGTELVVTEAVDKNHEGKSAQQCTTTHTQSEQLLANSRSHS